MCFFGSHKPQKTHGGGKHGFCAPQKYIWKGVAHIHVFFCGSHESKNDHKMAGKAYLPVIHLPFTAPPLNHTHSTHTPPHPCPLRTPHNPLPHNAYNPSTIPSLNNHSSTPSFTLSCLVLSCLFISSHVFYSLVLSCHLLSCLVLASLVWCCLVLSSYQDLLIF